MLERSPIHDWSFSASAESVIGALLGVTLTLAALFAVFA